MKGTYLLLSIIIAFAHSGTSELSVKNEGEVVGVLPKEVITEPLLGEPVIDHEKIEEFLDRMEQRVFQSPVNASIDKGENIIPGKEGYKLDRKAMFGRVSQFYYSGGSTVVSAPLIPIHPKVDVELLSEIREKQIGQYITYFNRKKKERATNISLAVEAINNHVVFPGETFSFNEVVGQRTKEKGYLSAPIIIKGKMYDGIGGGICQVSSTLFNAVDKAGMEITQRYTHSKRVSYVPPGRDATVSWHGPDFTFKNGYNQPILLRAKTVGGMVVVQVFSSDRVNAEPRDIN
ncbi:VanW family protein [Thalassorhabdus alkalitolerans]|uniref:VanW family protein n=1 Tax=Thalassorhabdus alkalitolerans TaxID=2282697 RepID=A0ABW0YNE2_9BACI